MFHRFLAVCLHVLLLAMPVHAAADRERVGVHGMVLFGGKDALYVSHLPMFHAPHDVQVVLRVRFRDAGLENAMRSRLDGSKALWTLEPTPFDLGRLAPQAPHRLEAFTANVVEGHFEQGGTLRHRDMQLLVEEVILYRALDPSPVTASVARYLPVGTFLVKLIDSRPDYDHIVLLGAPAPAMVEVGKAGMEANLHELAARLPVDGTIYFCADDLR